MFMATLPPPTSPFDPVLEIEPGTIEARCYLGATLTVSRVCSGCIQFLDTSTGTGIDARRSC